MLLQGEQMDKMTFISLKMVEVFILRENSCHFVSCSACINGQVIIFLAWVTCSMGQLSKFNTEKKDHRRDKQQQTNSKWHSYAQVLCWLELQLKDNPSVFLVLGFVHPIFRFWFLVTFLRNNCLHFARQDGKDGKNGKKITQLKWPKTKRRKYGMKETLRSNK